MNFPTGRRSTQTWGLSVFAVCDVLVCGDFWGDFFSFLRRLFYWGRMGTTFPGDFRLSRFVNLSRGLRGNSSVLFFPISPSNTYSSVPLLLLLVLLLLGALLLLLPLTFGSWKQLTGTHKHGKATVSSMAMFTIYKNHGRLHKQYNT